jgi:hypothetical protein
VTVLFVQVGDVRAGGLEDPQAEQPEHGHKREVIPIAGLARGGEQRLELQWVNPRVAIRPVPLGGGRPRQVSAPAGRR